MRFEGDAVLESFCRTFGIKAEDVTPAQVVFLIKIAKHCRLRCRSNAALYNWVRRAFPNMRYAEVSRTGRDGKPYKALSIESRINNHADVAVDDDSDE